MNPPMQDWSVVFVLQLVKMSIKIDTVNTTFILLWFSTTRLEA